MALLDSGCVGGIFSLDAGNARKEDKSSWLELFVTQMSMNLEKSYASSGS